VVGEFRPAGADVNPRVGRVRTRRRRLAWRRGEPVGTAPLSGAGL